MTVEKLPKEVQTYVVQALACFDSPSVVADAVNKEFALKVSRQAVEKYDPTKRAGERLSSQWRAIFDETRRVFLEDTSQIGISHRAVRLRALNRMADRAEGMGNMALAAQLHEQAAKECGDAFTNKRNVEATGDLTVQIIKLSDVHDSASG